MGFHISSLWRAPEVNPINHKARSIPMLNPLNMYGRVFFFTWFAFFISFWSWYAFPPLTTVTIKEDLNLSQADIATANIVALSVTCILRVCAGFACDRFGARWTYVVILFAGSLPTALAGTVTSAKGLIILRCFAGILGVTFVPCEVWSTAFFDKNIVGTSNAFAAGFGNAGGGITYWAMPAIFDSFVHNHGVTPHVAWRVTFLVPFILIISTALMIIFFCPDTPTGPWSARHRAVNRQLNNRDMFVTTAKSNKARDSRSNSDDKIELNHAATPSGEDAEDPIIAEQDLLAAASWELVEKPTLSQTTKAVFSLPTFTLLATYFCSFGSEVAVMSFLGAYYFQKFPSLGQTGSGNWASMFGLLNLWTRPLGGLVSDALYRPSGSVWARKIWLLFVCFLFGAFFCIIGFIDPDSRGLLFGLMVALAIPAQAANGACFSLVPHVHPSSNGIISGLAGAAGTLGGVVFTLVARLNGVNYPQTLRFIGIWTLATTALISWIPPISKTQLGGR